MIVECLKLARGFKSILLLPRHMFIAVIGLTVRFVLSFLLTLDISSHLQAAAKEISFMALVTISKASRWAGPDVLDLASLTSYVPNVSYRYQEYFMFIAVLVCLLGEDPETKTVNL
ncbi:hypothetical protein POJ06DRAFT_257579 [Lipomyces tetrasporus]|uniref:Uncharacterized protein n=1 Tax=Lipomyces tetrasporus TaxID=54092 RepID=A0AAD7QNH3_9ASCO|nr:uncharacterized protein POJ06DRAFT_257579 [Lipomyces tetrasporus]KAJ8098637.1 hypothetical protein POJ06DRAFT_257579 [Lipomyces tetrasporus]